MGRPRFTPNIRRPSVDRLRAVLARRERIEEAIPGCTVLTPQLSGSGKWEFHVSGQESRKFDSGEALITAVEHAYPEVPR
jgi:hypothetical protein